MKRITVIDAMRGIALIGICLTHALQHFGTFPSNAEPPYPWVGTMDGVTSWILSHFVMGKFFIIFSFLFGLSFFIQMDRAAQKGVDFRGRFLWRLILLFIIGLLHSSIFRNDILIIYALLGFPMVIMYRISNKLLIAIALFFLLGGAQLSYIGYEKVVKSSEKEVVEAPSERRQRWQTIFLTKPLSENIKHNLTEQLKFKFNFQFGKQGRGYITMGFFILGLLVGRLRLFENLDRYQPLLYRGGLIALGVVLLLYALQPYIPRGGSDSLLGWVSTLVPNMINLFSAYIWVVLIIWLYTKKPVQRALNRVVSYGRMGLTNYIVQSVAGVFIFYGFGLGLHHQMGTFFSVLICLGYTIVQIQASHYWLKKYRFGPVEWLWRSATYLKWQPLRKSLLAE